jgi:DNA ligase
MEFHLKTISLLVGLVVGTVNADNSKPVNVKQNKIFDFETNTPQNNLPLMLAKNFDSNVTTKHFFISEKYDGVRAYWNGKQLLSRSGRRISAPSWFTKDFPSVPLDGELWIERGSFEKVSATVRTKHVNPEDWQEIKYMVFDLPRSHEVFSDRVKQLEKLVNSLNSNNLKLIEQKRISGKLQVKAYLAEVIANQGEGVMLQHRNNLYTPGRSNGVFKLKPFHDAEAVVIAYLPGKGKYKGMMGAVRVRNKQGQVFKIGSGFSDLQRVNPPEIGSQITYRYRGKTTNDIPRFATFLRVRGKE